MIRFALEQFWLWPKKVYHQKLETILGTKINNMNGLIPYLGGIGMGFFPLSGEATKGEKEIFPWITKGTLYFPQEWLSRNGESKFPHELRSSEWGNLFLPWLLSHEWGKYNVPWVMNGEICPSLWLLTTEFTFTFRERKFDY